MSISDVLQIQKGVTCLSATIPRQVRRLPRVFYTIAYANNFRIPNNDLVTKLHAFVERVCLVRNSEGNLVATPRPWDVLMSEDVDYDQAEQLFIDMTAPVVEALSREYITAGGVDQPITYDQFLNHYVGSKRKIYEQAIESLRDIPFQDKRDGSVEIFIKPEYLKPGGVPRVISPRHPRYHATIGLYIKAIEDKIYNSIDTMWDPTGQFKTVAKKMDMIQRAEELNKMWSSYGRPRAVGFDAKRFDQHINSWLLKHLEHKIYKKVCHNTSPEHEVTLSRLLELQQTNIIKVGDRKDMARYTFEVDGVRMSGDMNTSLGNVTIMCCLMWLFREEYHFDFKMLNDGDDLVIVCDRVTAKAIKDKLPSFFLKFGIEMEFEGLFHTLEAIEFCQAHPVQYDVGKWIMVPNPSKRIFSDLLSEKPVESRKIYSSWLGAVGKCGCAMSPGVPILQEFYDWILRTPGVKPWIPKEGSYYYKYGYRKVIEGAKYKPVSEIARISFFKAYNIPPSEQIMLENMFRSLPSPSREILEESSRPAHTLPLEMFALPTYFKKFNWEETDRMNRWELDRGLFLVKNKRRAQDKGKSNLTVKNVKKDPIRFRKPKRSQRRRARYTSKHCRHRSAKTRSAVTNLTKSSRQKRRRSAYRFRYRSA
ncbi:hypothetical protein 2 [Beihai tombus-like virus 2]|uniref:hypothetical protein 2 n=1 Tax=Beihai tombus-like virus 2 TaxID=1922723 RepID=UPI00090C1471|nr:hypothetical protein 2 [Beihai tombus-like virus 2]APG76130.1 hypothetical protein 2 [Beihai tombus-like virus 2]